MHISCLNSPAFVTVSRICAVFDPQTLKQIFSDAIDFSNFNAKISNLKSRTWTHLSLTKNFICDFFAQCVKCVYDLAISLIDKRNGSKVKSELKILLQDSSKLKMESNDNLVASSLIKKNHYRLTLNEERFKMPKTQTINELIDWTYEDQTYRVPRGFYVDNIDRASLLTCGFEQGVNIQLSDFKSITQVLEATKTYISKNFKHLNEINKSKLDQMLLFTTSQHSVNSISPISGFITKFIAEKFPGVSSITPKVHAWLHFKDRVEAQLENTVFYDLKVKMDIKTKKSSFCMIEADFKGRIELELDKEPTSFIDHGVDQAICELKII